MNFMIYWSGLKYSNNIFMFHGNELSQYDMGIAFQQYGNIEF